MTALRNKHRPYKPNPFFDDMSELGKARRAKFHRDLEALVEHLKRSRPEPKDVKTNITVTGED